MFQFDKKVMSEQGSCVDLFNSALEELKIGFVAYGFRSNKKEFCGPLPDNAQVAFVLFDIPMNQKTLSVFGGNPEAGLDVRSEKYRAYSELNPLFQFPGGGVKGEYSTDPKGSWGTRIFGCDGSYAEDVVK